MNISKSIHKRDKKDRAGNVTGTIWRAKYRDESGNEHTRHFRRKVDGQAWLDQQTAGLVTGTHVAPRDAAITMREWSHLWLAGYGRNRPSSVRQARTHLKRINAEFGSQRLAEIRPSQVRAWVAGLQDEGLAQGTVHALYRRLVHVLNDAVEDGKLARNPCGRSTTTKTGERRIYLPTTEEIWALHEAFPEHLRIAVLLGAFAGLRVGEICGLRVADVDFLPGEIHPAVQYPAEPLKTAASRGTVPIPTSMVEALSRHVRDWSPGGGPILLDPWERYQVGPWTIQRAFRRARRHHEGAMRFHDTRHYFASLLIRGGADVKTIQNHLRHASAKTTLDVYGHMWPDSSERSRATVEAVFEARRESPSVSAGDYAGTTRS